MSYDPNRMDNLADEYDDWLAVHLPAMQRPGWRYSADELWHEIAHAPELDPYGSYRAWLLEFIERWEVAQAEEDLAEACRSRGEPHP